MVQLRDEVVRLRDIVALLQAESAAHIRGIGELQSDLNLLKKSTDLRRSLPSHRATVTGDGLID
jgi:hypothetical protein